MWSWKKGCLLFYAFNKIWLRLGKNLYTRPEERDNKFDTNYPPDMYSKDSLQFSAVILHLAQRLDDFGSRGHRNADLRQFHLAVPRKREQGVHVDFVLSKDG